MSHTTVEVVAFPYTQFQACVITGKAEVEWPPTLQIYIPHYSFQSHVIIIVHIHELVTIDELKKTVKDIELMVPEQMIQNMMGYICKKCEVCKQAGGDQFVSFFKYLKNQF